MDQSVPPNFEKWLRNYLKKEFATVVEKALEENEECSDIAQRIICSEGMSSLLNSIRATIAEHEAQKLKSASTALATESRPQSAFSYTSDLASEDWNSPKITDDYYNTIIDRISRDKPAHVRLAGYEILLKSDLTSLNNTTSAWDVLQKTLLDGVTDESRSVFEASLQVHAKLLSGPLSQSTYGNLLNAFDHQYHSQQTFEILPTLISGINFKFFLHEKLFRLAHLVIHHQEESLKNLRCIEQPIDDIIEQFLRFLSTHEFGNTMQPKTLNVLHIVSVLEPRADWCKRWILNLSTRKIFLTALSKSPSLMQRIMQCVDKGMKEYTKLYSPTLVSIYDDPLEVCINGKTIETVMYLHCLCFVSQLCAYDAGRKLLAESALETPFSASDFLLMSLEVLNKSSPEAPITGVYEVSRYALRIILEKPMILYDSKFHHAALCHLLNLPESDVKIWPHTLDVISHMLDTSDGALFFISRCKEHSPATDNTTGKCPATVLVILASNMLRQPLSIMNTDYLLGVFGVLEKFFDIYDSYAVVQDKLVEEFYPSVSYFYKKLDKYYFEKETKAQQINSAVKRLLLKMMSIPFALRALAQQREVFEELIRQSIAPLRTTWTKTEIVSFVVSAASFHIGYNVLANLAPHVLSTLLSETCKTVEDPQCFYDPWDHENVNKFLHLLAFFSLNFKCLAAFMTHSKEALTEEEQNCPLNLAELFNESVNPESEYHYLGLLSLNAVIWNLNILVYLLELLDFQNVLLELQNSKGETTETEGVNVEVENVIDNYSLLRHQILSSTYFIQAKDEEDTSKSEEYDLPILPPPKSEKEYETSSEHDYDTELENLLRESKPGLLDSNWVVQIRDAFKASRDPMKNSTLIQLVGQMQKAIPTAEWADDFQWQENISSNTDRWFLEETHGVNLALHYADQNEIMKSTDEAKENLQEFINASYAYIQYERPKKFDGFDWFLSTVFIICEGNVEKCKSFMGELVQFPSTVYLWLNLGKAIDGANNEECATQFTFEQLLENIVSNEFPNVKFALKSTCGMDWSMICNAMMAQLFWRILPWTQIMNFLAICVLYSPDYIVYYCASLLQHCQYRLMKDITAGKMWPESMDLDDYQCHNYIKFMDSLDKRYGNKVLTMMTVKEFESTCET